MSTTKTPPEDSALFCVMACLWEEWVKLGDPEVMLGIYVRRGKIVLRYETFQSGRIRGFERSHALEELASRLRLNTQGFLRDFVAQAKADLE